MVDNTPDAGAMALTKRLRDRAPFIFVRYGDGALECMAGRTGMTCDFEHYSSSLARDLAQCWDLLRKRPDRVFVGDWQTASFDETSEGSRYREQYELLFDGWKPNRIHFEALLLMRASRPLVEFYRTVKLDPRRKLFMGPEWNAGAAKMLGAEHLVTPLAAHAEWSSYQYEQELAKREFDILLYGAGMKGNIPAIRSWDFHPERTYINLGSAMDPLFYRRTRRQQLPMADLHALFRELL